ncbi:MAG: hypothetical protein WA862_06355 [Solirubrobacterales bacterium]
MPIQYFGNAKISPNGQAGLPIGLRRALGIVEQSRPIQVFADIEAREISLIEDVDPKRLYELLRHLNRSPGETP